MRPVGPDFYQGAHHRYIHTEVVRRPPRQVFDAIAGDPAGWGGWFPGFSSDGCWITPGPSGTGSRRRVRMAAVIYEETVLAWEPPSRFAFRVDRAGAPLAHALAEDYRIGAHPGGSAVQWTFAIEPRGVLRPALPLFDAALGRIFARAMANLEDRLPVGGSGPT
jgi:hypothetical protein